MFKFIKSTQKQSQSVNIAQQEHGLIEEVSCSHRNYMVAFQKVKIIVYHGQVTRVFCEYYQNKLCTSPFHKGPVKICNIKTEI